MAPTPAPEPGYTYTYSGIGYTYTYTYTYPDYTNDPYNGYDYGYFDRATRTAFAAWAVAVG